MLALLQVLFVAPNKRDTHIFYFLFTYENI